ncbi:MAG: hypothetical protein AAF387_20125 [Pseudomonadota bacterium]
MNINDPPPLIPNIDGEFATNIDLDDGVLAIGEPGNDQLAFNAGVAHLYDVDDLMLGYQKTIGYTVEPIADSIGDFLCHAIALQGETLVCGSPHRDSPTRDCVGGARVFDVNSGELLHTLNNPNPATCDLYGVAVALHNDKVIVGSGFADADIGAAENSASVGEASLYDVVTGQLLHIFSNPGGNSGTEGDFFGGFRDGDSIAMNDKVIVIGAPEKDVEGSREVGVVYIYNANSFDLIQTLSVPDNPIFPQFDKFGYSVELSGDYLAIAAISGDKYDASGSNIIDYSAGKVYVYKLKFVDPAVIYPIPVPYWLLLSYMLLVALSGVTRLVIRERQSPGKSSR